jgi:hypothetical protein
MLPQGALETSHPLSSYYNRQNMVMAYVMTCEGDKAKTIHVAIIFLSNPTEKQGRFNDETLFN